MRLVVIGANGRTGAAVVQQARLRGEDVVALARRPEKLSCVAAGAGNRSTGALVARRADLLTGEGIAESLAGVDAVVSAVGIGASRQPTRLYSNGTANLLEAMHAAGVPRLAVVSAAPVGSRGQHPPLQRAVVLPILERLFGATYEDMRRMEQILRESDLAWTALRPPRLLERPGTGAYRIDDRPLPKGKSLTIPDLATALLDCLPRPDTHRRALFVAN